MRASVGFLGPLTAARYRFDTDTQIGRRALRRNAAREDPPYDEAMHDAVTVHIAAPPGRIWALVSDVTRIGRYSPETFEAEWLDGAGPAVGARFRGHVKRNGKGPTYWTTCTVLECMPDRVFAFGVGPSDRPLNVWRYQLEPTGDGTDVTESFALAKTPMLCLYWALLGWARGRTNRDGMGTTLERIKAEVE
jgi:uncharacterized protein YndB with AHSA1/START domain